MYRDLNFRKKINQIVLSNMSNPELKGELIADELGVNRMYLHRKLKDFYDTNARDYIQKTRIDYAKKQLKKTTHSIQDIALKIGYEDISYFSKTFKKATGYSPSMYRKENS